MKSPIAIDFETQAIEPRPNYPPEPVGVAIKYPGVRGQYYAFGHRSKNNALREQAVYAVRHAFSDPAGVVFHNAKFDLEVARVHFGIPYPQSWKSVHDTMFLLFLDDPRASSLGLKEAAERLGCPPIEQDKVRDWLIHYQPVPGVTITDSRKSKNYFAKFISHAPGDLVGEYAIGDVDRTAMLFDKLLPGIKQRGLMNAYDRERQLLFVLLDMEARGVPVDVYRLRLDVKHYENISRLLTAWVKRQLRCSDLNIRSMPALFDALKTAGHLDESKLELSTTGKPSLSIGSLRGAVLDVQLFTALKYLRHLDACVSTFMRPWLSTAESSGGVIYTSWHQVRDADAGGARTGRLSSSPNFQNVPREFSISDTIGCPIGRGVGVFKNCKKILWPKLPKVRSYIIPSPGEYLLDRDYNQQELRILAHYEGTIVDRYKADPWLDFHTAVQEQLGGRYDRYKIKAANFGLVYGMGDKKLASQLDIPVDEAREIKREIKAQYPGIEAMYRVMRRRAKENKPIRTWGGREYLCEADREINGRVWTFDYRLVNTLIQGSAADCTKEAMVRFFASCDSSWKIVLCVHDQIVISVPRSGIRDAMECLRGAMEMAGFDVPMLSEGRISRDNWGEMIDYDKRGVLV